MGRKGPVRTHFHSADPKLSEVIALYKEPFVEIGYIRKGHGFQGHAKVVLYSGFEEVLTSQSFLFFEIEGYHVPFYIEERQFLKDLIIKFQFIDSVEELKDFQGTRLFLLKRDLGLEDLATEQIPSRGLAGYLIIDIQIGDLGKIIRVDSYPQQEMAIVLIDGKEVLIPLHPELIETINEKEEWIKMRLPEGILDI